MPFRLVYRVLYEDHFLIFAAVSVPAAAADDDDEGVAVSRKTRLFRPDAVVSAFPIGTIGCHRTDKSRKRSPKKTGGVSFSDPDFKYEVFRQLE